MNRLLIVISRTPYGSTHVLESLETALVGAVFDFEVSLLFRDEGVWCLLPQQQPEQLEQRNIGKMLTALDTYDIQQLYVCAPSLNERGLSSLSGVVTTTPLSYSQQADLITQQTAVIGA